MRGPRENRAFQGRLFSHNSKSSDFEEVEVAQELPQSGLSTTAALREGSGMERLMRRG